MAAKKVSPIILVVEDERTLNEAYQIILRKNGYTVHTAYDGEEALQVAAQHEPTLILLDMRMPRLDGIGFLRRYNLLKNHPRVKVVIFSNYDMQKVIDEAYRLCVAHYILKAWASPKGLLQVVKHTLAQAVG